MGVLQMMTVDQIQRQEQQAAEESLPMFGNDMLISGLGSHIKHHWEINKRARLKIEPLLERCLRNRNGEYSPSKLAEIREIGGSEIYMNLTATKCRAGVSWISDFMLPAGDKAWGIDPTPVADLSPNDKMILEQRIWQEIEAARQQGVEPGQNEIADRRSKLEEMLKGHLRDKSEVAAEKMETKIEDQLTESGYYDELADFIDDFCTFPTAFFKGPIYQRKKTLKWGSDNSPVVTEEVTVIDKRVSPFDCFPAPGADSCDDGAFIERLSLSRSEIYNMLGMEGYNDEVIREVLEGNFVGQLSNWQTPSDSTQQDLELRDLFDEKDEIEGVHFWGSAKGQDLIDWGMQPDQIDDPLREYQVDAIMVGGNFVVRAMLNPDPLGRRPYYSASYQRRPGSIWGTCPPLLMEDTQAMCNGAGRAIANNMGLAAGPMIGILTDRLPAGESITGIHPLKTFQMVSDKSGNNVPPIQFFQAQSIAGDLLAVYKHFEQQADVVTGIPKYGDGNEKIDFGNLGDRGLAMLMESMSKSMKLAIRNIDNGVVRPRVTRQYHDNMLYEKDPAIKGDLQVVARGASELINKASTQLKRAEFLAMTANPVDLQLIGKEARTDVLRDMAKDVDINTVPNKEEVKKQLEQEAQQEPPKDPAVQLEEMRAQKEMAVLDKKMQDAERERQLKEAISYMELQGDMMQLSGQQDISLQKIKSDLGIAAMKEQGANKRLHDEAAIKARFGSGI